MSTTPQSRVERRVVPSRQSSVNQQATACDLAVAVQALCAADPVLARLIDTVGPCRLETNRTQSIFDALSRAIVYQQLTGKAAATIHARVGLLSRRKKNGFTPRDILEAGEDELRGTGLSRAKAAALRDLAQKVTAREIPTLAQVSKMDSESIIERLTTVRGVGRWSVEMLLIFRLGRMDVLPVDDYGVRKGFALTYRKGELPSPKQLAQYGEKWAPWRSVASWYLWRAADAGAPRRA